MTKEELIYSKSLMAELAHPNPTDNLCNHLDYFSKVLKNQNDKSENSTINKRLIEYSTIEDNPNRIQLNIYSEVPLEYPGRALAHFSRSLISGADIKAEEYDSFFADNTFHGKLFTFHQTTDTTVSEPTMNNEEMLHAIIRLCYKQQSTLPAKEKNALKEIKAILTALNSESAPQED